MTDEKPAAPERDDDLITAAEAARARVLAGRVGTNRNDIIRWEASGALPRAATVNGLPVFRRADVLTFVSPSERPDDPAPPSKDEPGS